MKSSALYLFYARYFWHPLAVTLPHLTQHIFILSLPIHLQLCPLHLNKNSQPLYQVHAQYWHCILPSIFQWYISIIHPTSTYSLNLNTRLTSYSAYFKSVLPSVRHGYSIPYGYGSRGMSGIGQGCKLRTRIYPLPVPTKPVPVWVGMLHLGVGWQLRLLAPMVTTVQYQLCVCREEEIDHSWLNYTSLCTWRSHGVWWCRSIPYSHWTTQAEDVLLRYKWG